MTGRHRAAPARSLLRGLVGDPLAEREIRQAAELHVIAARILAGYSQEG